MSDETPTPDADVPTTDDLSATGAPEETAAEVDPEGGELIDDPSPSDEEFPLNAEGAPYDPTPENTTEEAQRAGTIPREGQEVEHPNLNDYGQINNSVVWTIVGILAIIALLIFIISAISGRV